VAWQLNDLIVAKSMNASQRMVCIHLPQRSQTKDTAGWRVCVPDTLPGKPPTIDFGIDLVNGSMIRLYGADNPMRYVVRISMGLSWMSSPI
jgi:hypothetical protein